MKVVALVAVCCMLTVTAVALGATNAAFPDAPIAILRERYTHQDRLPGIVWKTPASRFFLSRTASRLAISRYGFRAYVVAAKRNGLCLLDAREKVRGPVSFGFVCAAASALDHSGAIMTAYTRIEGTPFTVVGIVPDGYTRVTFHAHVGHVRNNVFVLRADKSSGTYELSGRDQETRRVRF